MEGVRMARLRAIDYRQLMEDVLANGKVKGNEVATLRRELYADGQLDRRAADFLAELYKRTEYVSPGFEQFFSQAVKDHLLADGKLTAEKAAWLRQLLGDRAKVTERERRFLHELRGQAREVSPEFGKLLSECDMHIRQHTSG
jgi:hypothetical protein